MCHLLTRLLICVLLIAGPVIAQEQPRGLFATGSAEMRVPPDMAYITVGVTTEAATAAKAAQDNAAKALEVIAALGQAGVPRADIQTTGYHISPVMDYEQRPAVTVGYRASNSVQVRVKDTKRVGPLLDAATGAGANVAQGVQWVVENDQEVRRQAIAEAIDEAKKTAQVMAKELGVTIVGVTSITESGGVMPPPIAYGIARADVASTPIEPGEVTVNVSVTINYAITGMR